MKITPGIYQHFKGKKYQVLFFAKHSETLEDLVVYKALYQNEVGKYWVRPLKMFKEKVIIEGKKIPRFSKLT